MAPFRPFFLLAALAAIAGTWPRLPGGEALLPTGVPAAAWSASLAVMASMIRRQTRKPFATSAMLTVSFALVLSAPVSRLLAECGGDYRPLLLRLAAAGWIAAFLLFLLTFRGELLRRRQVSPRTDQAATLTRRG